MVIRQLFFTLSVLILALTSSSSYATLIAKWDFGPVSLSGAPGSWNTLATAPTLPADVGTGSLLAYTNSFIATGVQHLPSLNSSLIVPDDGTEGLRIYLDDSRRGTFEISFSTIGMEDIQFELDFSRSSGSYSWGGVAVRNNVGQSYIVGPMVQTAPWDRTAYDLSSFAGINNQPNVTIWITGRNAATNNQIVSGVIDNLVITGSLVVPEPSTSFLACSMMLLGIASRRR